MRKSSAIATGLAVIGMIVAATAQAGITRSAEATTTSRGDRADVCTVQVNRTESSGVFSVDRETLQDGSCVCHARTGPVSQGGSAEAALSALLESRECADGPPGGYASGGGLGTTALILAGLAGGGLAVGLSSGGCKSAPCGN